MRSYPKLILSASSIFQLVLRVCSKCFKRFKHIVLGKAILDLSSTFIYRFLTHLPSTNFQMVFASYFLISSHSKNTSSKTLHSFPSFCPPNFIFWSKSAREHYKRLKIGRLYVFKYSELVFRIKILSIFPSGCREI